MSIAGRAGNLAGLAMQRREAVFETKPLQPVAMNRIAVGRSDIGAGPKVVAVHVTDQIGRVDQNLGGPQRGRLACATGQQLLPHPAIQKSRFHNCHCNRPAVAGQQLVKLSIRVGKRFVVGPVLCRAADLRANRSRLKWGCGTSERHGVGIERRLFLFRMGTKSGHNFGRALLLTVGSFSGQDIGFVCRRVSAKLTVMRHITFQGAQNEPERIF
jgi:hypothetical protein